MKYTFLFLALFTFYVVSATQPQPTAAEPDKQELLSPDQELIQIEGATGVDSVAVLEYLTHVNRWLATCGGEGKLLYEQGKAIGLNVKDVFKDLPLPNTKEGLTAWVERIDLLFGSLGSIIVMLLTWFSSIFKKNPEAAIGQIQAVYNSIRTRYLLFGSALVVTIVSLFYFDKDGIGFSDVLQAVGVFLGVTVGGLGFQNLLSMLGIKWFEAKKV